MPALSRPALCPRNLSRIKPSSGSADVDPGGDNITIRATFRHIDVFNRDLFNSIVRSFGTQCLLLPCQPPWRLPASRIARCAPKPLISRKHLQPGPRKPEHFVRSAYRVSMSRTRTETDCHPWTSREAKRSHSYRRIAG